MQPASQSAGYEEEQPNPPTLGLDVSVTVIAAPLGVSSLGQSRLRSSGGKLPRRVVVAKVWGRGRGGDLRTSNTVCLLKPNREMFDTNKTRWAGELTSLPLATLLSFLFLLSIEVSSQGNYCTSLTGTSQQSTPGPLPIVRFPYPRAESLLLWLFKKCSASDITPLHHRRRLVKTAWITPNLGRQILK